MPELQMPKLSDTMTEGTLVAWKKKKGEKVAAGEVLAEIETDKATMEWESPEDGTLTEIYVDEGGKVEVGQRIAFIGEPGESGPAEKQPEAKKDEPKTAKQPQAETEKPAPAETKESELERHPDPPSGYAELEECVHRTVLCVEDNLPNLQLIERLMARFPTITLLSAVRGEQGAQFARERLRI